MSKLSWMIAAIALGGVACTASDDKKVTADAGMDASLPGADAGNGGDPFAECDVDKALVNMGPAGEKWTKEKPWTFAQAESCFMTCEDFECVEAMCPNGKEYLDCYFGELSHCAADGDRAPCRDDFSTLACCFDEAQCFAEEPGLVYEECFEPTHVCAPYADTYGNCLGDADRCAQRAQSACIVPKPMDTGMQGDAGPDAGSGASMPKSLRMSALRALSRHAFGARVRKTR